MTSPRSEPLTQTHQQPITLVRKLSVFLSPLLRFFIPPLLPNSGPQADLDLVFLQGRERLLTAMLRTLVVLGLLSLLLALPTVIREEQGRILTFYIVFLGLIGLAALNRKLDYRLRAGLLLSVEYSLGLIDLLNFGLAEDGRIYLFGFSVIAIVLLGPWGGLGALGLSVTTIALVGWLTSQGQLVSFQASHIPAQTLTVETAIITTAVFLMQAGMVMAALYLLLRSLEIAWQRERQVTYLLEQQRNLLEQRVAERTQELVLARDQALKGSQLKTELLARVSHELRTPLGIILGYAEMLREKFYGALADEQYPPLESIIENSHALTRQLRELLDQARLGADKLQLQLSAFSLDELINGLEIQTQALAQAKGLSLTIEIADEMPPTLWGDPLRLQQILTNLIGNAIKFTQAGSVWVYIYRPQDNQWVIQVSDTGPGILVEAWSLIFEPFQQVDGSMTRRHGGVGLGLSIVKQLVKLMGGEVSLESEIGRGSTFTVTLPLVLPQEELIEGLSHSGDVT
jgi:signal transduction histidine kinase